MERERGQKKICREEQAADEVGKWEIGEKGE